MVDTVQLILVLVIVILTVLLVILGIQVFFILRDLRKTIVKANRVLDNAGEITDNVTGPVAALSGLVSSLKAGSAVTIVKLIRNILSKDRDDVRRRREE